MSFQKLGWLTVIVLLLTGFHATAATNVAASVSFADVSAAVNSSATGDTILMPPGTAHWTTPLDMRGKSLLGSGTNLTIIYDDMDRNANPNPPLIFVRGVATNYLQVGNFQLVGGNETRNWHGEIATDHAGPIRIHHVYFNLVNDKALMLYGANRSLVDHCYFKMKYAAILIRDGGYGDAAWATPPNYGTDRMPVIEDCVFTNIDPASASANVVDCEFGGRSTFRKNLVYDAFFEAHGTESGARQRGGRAFEVYSNTFIHNPLVAFPCAVNLRAGSGVFYGNTTSGYYYFANVNVNRANERFAPWNGADGRCVWDDNTGTNYLSGVHAGASGVNYLQVAGANWTPNQWVGYTVVNLDWTNNYLNWSTVVPNGQTNFNFAVIITNSANRIYYHISKDYNWMYFTNGNRFVVNKVNHVLDQPGLGSGDLITGEMQPWGADPINSVLGVSAWPREVVEGIYSWNNTLNGANVGFTSDCPHVRENFEYFNNTPKPGYTPLVYPHPLQSGTSGSTATNTGALLPPARVWVQL